jgi:hypothetical protein
MPSVSPKNAPAGFVPFHASTMEMADWFRLRLEDHYRNHFEMTLDWDETDPDKHISVSFTYSPEHLNTDWEVSAD